MVLRRLSALPPPKVVFYFGDTIRSRPGQVYVAPRERIDIGPGDSFAAAEVFDAMLNDAGASGVRIYAIQAGRPHRLRGVLRDAQHTLSSLGKQTGGGHFLYGTPAEKMAKAVREDLSCLYVLSFDPTGLPEDRRLGVQLRVTKPKVNARTRKQIIVHSESARTASRMMAALATPELGASDLDLTGSAIATGFKNGKYSALLQVASPASPLSETQWNLGVSLLSQTQPEETVQGNVSIDRPAVPVVFEAELEVPPGYFEVVLVAQENAGEVIGAERIHGEWPDPDDAPVTIGPIAVLQPQQALFLRDEKTKTRGFLGCAPDRAVSTDLPTALVSLICRGRSRKLPPLRVERRLVGSDAAVFPDTEIDLSGKDRCAQIRDVIPARTMTEGGFTYEIRAFQDGSEVSVGERRFVAMSPGSPAAEAVER
jgi:hypothetical protein